MQIPSPVQLDHQIINTAMGSAAPTPGRQSSELGRLLPARQVTIVGAGNAAQVMAALITHNGSRVHMYVPKKKLMLMVAQRIITTDMACHSR